MLLTVFGTTSEKRLLSPYSLCYNDFVMSIERLFLKPKRASSSFTDTRYDCQIKSGRFLFRSGGVGIRPIPYYENFKDNICITRTIEYANGKLDTKKNHLEIHTTESPALRHSLAKANLVDICVPNQSSTAKSRQGRMWGETRTGRQLGAFTVLNSGKGTLTMCFVLDVPMREEYRECRFVVETCGTKEAGDSDKLKLLFRLSRDVTYIGLVETSTSIR